MDISITALQKALEEAYDLGFHNGIHSVIYDEMGHKPKEYDEKSRIAAMTTVMNRINEQRAD